MDRPAKVVHCANSDCVDKAFPRAWEGVPRDRRDVSQEKLDDYRAIHLGRDTARIQRCVWASCSRSGMESPDDGDSRPVLAEGVG